MQKVLLVLAAAALAALCLWIVLRPTGAAARTLHPGPGEPAREEPPAADVRVAALRPAAPGDAKVERTAPPAADGLPVTAATVALTPLRPGGRRAYGLHPEVAEGGLVARWAPGRYLAETTPMPEPLPWRPLLPPGPHEVTVTSDEWADAVVPVWVRAREVVDVRVPLHPR